MVPETLARSASEERRREAAVSSLALRASDCESVPERDTSVPLGRAMSKFAVILAAAGKSSRFKDKNYKKPFVPLANRAVWLHSAERFLGRDYRKGWTLA